MKVIVTSSLILFLVSILYPLGMVMGSGYETQNLNVDSNNPPMPWEIWNRDADHNGIDDVLDDKIAKNAAENTRILIDYDHSPNEIDIDLLSKFDLEIIYVYRIIDTICARNVSLSNIEAISNLPGVVMVEYEDEMHAHLDVSSRAVKVRDSAQYSPETVTDLGFFGANVSVAIVDTGVDDRGVLPNQHHVSVDDMDDDIFTWDPKFIAGVDYTAAVIITDGSFNPDDLAGHGTHCAGIAIGTGDGAGEYEYRGIAPQARLVDVKVLEDIGAGFMGNFISGVEWCVDHKDEFNIRVLSMSLGASYNSNGNDAASQAVNAATEAGIISVIASGNDGARLIPPPASADTAIVVGSLNDHNTVTRSDDSRSGFSNYGPRNNDNDGDDLDEFKPDVLAPGQAITSCLANSPSGYISMSGTSMATPHVAGIIALMIEANPDITPEEVKQILHETAEMPGSVSPSYPETDPDYNARWGWGMVDGYKAVQLAILYNPNPPVISDVEVVDVTDTQAIISWITDKHSDSVIEYGTTLGYGNTSSDPTFVRDHEMTLTGLLSNKTYYFKIKATDELGHGPSESGPHEFTTEVAPDTTPPQIVLGPSVTGIDDSKATVRWVTNEVATSIVEYGLDENYGEVKSDPSYVTEHIITLRGLEPETTYHYMVRSADPSGNENFSEDDTFTTQEDMYPPVITYGPEVYDITETGATIYWETDEEGDSLVRYGETATYGIEVSDDTLSLTHSIPLTDLSPLTLYHYQVESTDVNSNTITSIDFNFTTIDTTPPQITNGPVVINILETEATIIWDTDEECDSLVRYGETTAYGNEELNTTLTLSHSITLYGLTSATTYHYQLECNDTYNNTMTSLDFIFMTNDTTPPEIISGPEVAFINDTGATIVWETNEESDSLVRYGETQAYGNEEYDPILTSVHSINMYDLTPDNLYHFQVESTDLFGNPNTSLDFNFTTTDSTPPEIVLDPDVIDLQETQATVYWETNEESDSLVRYGEDQGYGSELSDETLTFYHTITITGLTKLETYHFQVKSTDRHGNNVTSLDFDFTTPDTTDPIITAGPFVTSTTANGATIEWSTDEPSTSLVEYWITEQEIPYIESDFTLSESHIMTLEGLQEDTLYSFTVKSVDESGNEEVSDEMSFATPDETPPQITFGPVVHNKNDTAARITWKTDEHSNSIVEYGPTTSYGNISSSSSFLKNHEIWLRDLTPLTLYHFQVISYDKVGNPVTSSDLNFTTEPPIDRTPPKILDGPEITKHEDTTIVIYWTTDELSDAAVEYGTSTDYEYIEIISEFSQSHSIWLMDLSPNTTYHYRLISKDEAGNEVVSSDYTVTTKESFPDLNINVKNLGDYDEVHGTVMVEGEITGAVGDVDYIWIKIDNESWQELDPDDSFNFEIDTGGLSEGTHTLVIMVGDDNERVATTAVILIVKNPDEESQDIWAMLLPFIAIIMIATVLIAYILVRNRSKKSQRGFGYGTGAMAPQGGSLMFTPEGPSYPPASFAPIEMVRCPKCNVEFETEITGATIVCPSCYYTATT